MEAVSPPPAADPSALKALHPALECLLFAAAEPHPVIERLRTIDPNTLTPLDALALLAQFVADARPESPAGRAAVAPDDTGD